TAFFIGGCEKKEPLTSASPKEEVPSPQASPSPSIAGVAPEKKIEKETPPSPALKKLYSQLMLALKQSRGEPPFDKPTSLQPDIPARDGNLVLVDMDGTVSDD